MSPQQDRSANDNGHRLSPEQLRWRCDPARFDFATTADIGECPINIIGQSRALDALRLGLSVRSEGYNVFVVGDVGSGRSTTVRRTLGEVERGEVPPGDLAYVHNFRDPDQPVLLEFPAGRGRSFSQAMVFLVESLSKTLRQLFESEEYREQRTSVIEQASEHQKAGMKAFEKEIDDEGFALMQVKVGPLVRPELVPVIEGKPAEMDQLESLVEQQKFPREELERLKAKHGELRGRLDAKIKEFRVMERKLRERLQELDRDLARPIIDEAIGEVREQFPGEKIEAHLDDVAADMLGNLADLQEDEPAPAAEHPAGDAEEPEVDRYAVNVVVDNSKTKGRPIIWEKTPSYRNLFGTIEKSRQVDGGWHSDHTRIRAGGLLRASGGFLVLDAMDVLTEPGVWPALKRSLRNRSVEIQSFDPFSLFASISLKPEPAPIDVRVVMIGTRYIYHLLRTLDEDFAKIFKVKAEFATRTEFSDEEVDNYVCFVHKKCQDDDLAPFTREAVGGVIEHAMRLAGHHCKLTTRFGEIADVIREAGYWAKQEQAEAVGAAHVDRALEQRVRRVDLLAEMLRERITEGIQLLDTEGSEVGQVNGLAVLDVGDHVFGQPSRITASVAMGRAGIIDIEREAEMGGATHTKGMLILTGFLRERFAQSRPLALSASLCFEQSYGTVDGDSASSTELYALLSSLSDVPIRQGVAVTGSVNQKGEVQAIGGVNEKIEGYFDVCRLLGFRGTQGVMIPAANLPQLMLRKDVVEAVERGEFNVWAVATIEQGIEVLTGAAAGERGDDGAYPSDSVFGKVDAKLGELAELVREFGPADVGYRS